ncbi:acyl-CoA dehydrogenase family member 10 [Emericellopsis atlantica]|uniref:Acyl-CoA dehydrogenase family member 10 n=1 Tax=Emericellopsis atlantica TaxID=2614577 RepID=A0A9P8CTK5_9HYPO|nr:acyl-CoA dehydrogenase family member 10 [Emericellopsis atlantica]KAG9258345.1 acyl-CoA dehydrogenase family member 10 [Emericellopsis atlantica]
MASPQPSHLDGPAFAHIPAPVKAKLRPFAIDKIQRIYQWMETEIIPREPVMDAQLAAKPWGMPPLLRELRARAKEEGLWNLFLPNTFKESPGLTNLEYGCMCELMGRCYWGAMVFNCHAPDTGNCELLAKYCSEEQKEKWLKPLLEGTCGSGYSMTEPSVATSDATNVGIRITKNGDDYVINGRKLYSNCLWNKHLKFYILMGLSDPENPNPWRRHSMLIVPADSPGLTQVRNLTVLGYDWAPEGHGEYTYDNVVIPKENLILGEGRAFEIAQGRLGGGRIHHTMRLLGQAERAVELAIMRCRDPRFKPRGKLIGDFDSNIERVAQMRLELDAMRLVVLNAAETIDLFGPKAGRKSIAQCKVLVPKAVQGIVDECMQIFGGQGVTQHTPLPGIWAYARWARLADGPDSAHRHQVGRDELKKAVEITKRHQEYNRLAKVYGEKHGEKVHMMPEDSL